MKKIKKKNFFSQIFDLTFFENVSRESKDSQQILFEKTKKIDKFSAKRGLQKQIKR